MSDRGTLGDAAEALRLLVDIESSAAEAADDDLDRWALEAVVYTGVLVVELERRASAGGKTDEC